MKKCYNYSLLWRYDFNNSKNGVVVYDETKSVHFNEMKEGSWLLGDDTVDELYKYQNFWLFKIYCDAFSTNIDENIEKATAKTCMIFSTNVDHRKTNPFVYIEFCKQVCLPFLLFRLSYFLSTKLSLKNLNNVNVGF